MGRHRKLGKSQRQIALEHGVSKVTVGNWIKQGLSDSSPQGVNEFLKARKAQRPSAEVHAKAREWGMTYSGALHHVKKGTTPKPKLELKGPRHWSAPSTQAVWYLAEIARDLKSFPDWGCLWDNEQAKKREAVQKAKKWQETPREKRDAINARIRAFRSTDEHREKRREYKRKKVEADPSIKIQGALRTRLRKFIRGNNKSGIRNLLGCSWLQFRRHLESQFTRGITWENYGTHWHVDHIIPCKAFDHGNPAQVRQCWHFTNLRPLEASANMAKGAKIEAPQLSLLLTA
jgi:hypothetical protein